MKTFIPVALSLALMGAGSAQALDNVALLGTATQSSNWTSEAVAGAAKAIDGNTDGVWTGSAGTNSIQHTGLDSGNGVGNGFAWWQVALDQDYGVDSVTLWNRTDCCISRASQFTVTLFNDGVAVWSGVYNEATGPQPSVTFAGIATTGDTLRVQLDRADYLHMAEVQVFANAVPEPQTYALMIAGLAIMGAAVRRRV